MRYLKVSLFIGIIVAVIVAGLHEIGLLRPLDVALAAFLGADLPPLRADRALQITLSIVFAIGIAWTTIDISRNSLKVMVAAGAFAEVIAGTWILHAFGIFFSPFVSLFSIAASFGASFAYSRSEGGMRKRVVRGIFGDRVSRQTFQKLVNSDVSLGIEGAKIEASIVVCEIFNHEQLADSLPVDAYVAMNNAFLRNAADFLVERGGYLDECDGESLRVIFGTPLPDPDHAQNACKAALDLTTRLDAVNRECAQIWQKTFDFRIGVNSGEIVVAAYGSRRLGNFSVAGEPVEFARRLCAANGIYGSHILIGTATFADAEQTIEVRPMELIHRHQDTQSREEIYELLSLRNALTDEERERRDLFWKGIVYYRERLWDEALNLFHSARTPDGSDGPVEFYIRRIQQLREGLPALEMESGRL